MKGRNQRRSGKTTDRKPQQQSQDDYVKKSGAQAGVDKNGKPWVNGWKVKNGQMYSIYARPSEKTSRHKGDKHEWEDWIFSLKIDDVPTAIAGKPIGVCLYDVTTGKVIIKDMGYVLNPKAPNGGYCGRYGTN